jgi:hypothetical protein
MRARGDLKVLTAEHRMPPDIAMKRPVPQHLQAHSLRGALAEGDDWEDFAEDDNASDCSWRFGQTPHTASLIWNLILGPNLFCSVLLQCLG